MRIFAGVDIGGTKCAICLGRVTIEDRSGSKNSDSDALSGLPEVIGRRQFLTMASPEANIREMIALLDDLMHRHLVHDLQSIGISCGGPLDSRRGLILSPPNLPHWDRVDIVTPFRTHFGVPTGLENDANACALVEWRWGAGRGCRNVIFLTFGTGMGAGLILDGRLYSGTNNMAGEVGHIRLEEDGPIGYGKAGSFAGFCSGGGIAMFTVPALARGVFLIRFARGDSSPPCDPDRANRAGAARPSGS